MKKELQNELTQNEKTMREILPTDSYEKKREWSRLYKRNKEIILELNK